jgi:hypothetical protein
MSLNHYDLQVAKQNAVVSLDWETATETRDAQDALLPELNALLEQMART